MSFVLDQTWDESARLQALAGSPSASVWLLAKGRDRHLRRASATSFSVIVHILLIWLFLNKLAGDPGPNEEAERGNGGLLLFALSDPGSVSAAASATEPLTAPPASAWASEADASVAAELPPEWSVSRLPPAPDPLPLRPPPAPAASTLSGSALGTGATGAGAGKGDVGEYDPYAGAAPRWREGAQGASNQSLGQRLLDFFGVRQAPAAGLTLDAAALESVRRAIAAALPGRQGTAELVVRVSPTGMVLEVKARGGSAPAEARDALGRALVGKRLYRGSAAEAQTLALPVLSLG
jgi:hypothetical protein